MWIERQFIKLKLKYSLFVTKYFFLTYTLQKIKKKSSTKLFYFFLFWEDNCYKVSLYKPPIFQQH